MGAGDRRLHQVQNAGQPGRQQQTDRQRDDGAMIHSPYCASLISAIACVIICL
jgi:hypothetical protein